MKVLHQCQCHPEIIIYLNTHMLALVGLQGLIRHEDSESPQLQIHTMTKCISANVTSSWLLAINNIINSSYYDDVCYSEWYLANLYIFQESVMLPRKSWRCLALTWSLLADRRKKQSRYAHSHNENREDLIIAGSQSRARGWRSSELSKTHLDTILHAQGARTFMPK